MKKLKNAMFVLFLMTASVGFSQTFNDFDANADGSVDRNEFDGVYSNNFDNWDQNRDGDLDDREFYETNFNRLDSNMDGNLGQNEWDEGYDNVFGDYVGTRDYGEYDENNDGMLSSEEYYNAFSESDYYTSYDVNRDNRLDANELNEGVFNDWDENSDGVLDSTEYNRYSSNYIDW